MEIHSQLVVQPGALAGTRAPALWAVVAVLGVAGLATAFHAWRSVPASWTQLPSYELVPLRAGPLVIQRLERFATQVVPHGEVVAIRVEPEMPLPLLQALVPLGPDEGGLRVHDGLTLGPTRLGSLSRPGLRWSISLYDRQIVRIASDAGDLLPYREFQTMDALSRRWLWGWALGCLAACTALGWNARRLLLALERRDQRLSAEAVTSHA